MDAWFIGLNRDESVLRLVFENGCSERIITILGSKVNIASTDRIRLTIHVETGSINDPKGVIFTTTDMEHMKLYTMKPAYS